MDPITWIYIIILIISLAASYAMRPKPQNAKPPSLADFSVPTAEEGRDIQVIFGECWIDDPNVLWYGDLRTAPIKGEDPK
jgi:hypothetical protein